MARQVKRIIIVVFTMLITFSVIVFIPVTTEAEEDYSWETWGNRHVSKFSETPKTGTFIITNSDYAEASFARRVDIESAGVYEVSVEVKVEGFKTNPANPQEWSKLMVGDITNDSFNSRASAGVNIPDNKWTNISCKFVAAENDSVYLQLCLGVGKGKATFCNVKLEKVSNEVIYQESMAPRDYDVLKDKDWAQTARGIDVKNFGFPKEIGKTTLTYESAATLIGKKPSEIAKQVKTVSDVLQYMVASRFGYAPSYYTHSDADNKLQTSNGSWIFDHPGNEQLTAGYHCCCGGMANMVSYLLQGDYDKVGVLRWIGNNHVINWVQTEGKYYVFDFVALMGGGSYDNLNYPVVVLDKLEDYYDNFPEAWYKSHWDTKKSDIIYMAAFECGAAAYPTDWNEEQSSSAYFTFPKFAEGEIITIYKKKFVPDISYKDITLPSSYYKYWGISAPAINAKPAQEQAP